MNHFKYELKITEGPKNQIFKRNTANLMKNLNNVVMIYFTPKK